MRRHFTKFAKVLAAFVCAVAPQRIDAAETALTAQELATKLGAAIQDGDSVARVRFKSESSPGAEGSVLQLQIKSRRTAGKSDVAYLVLWPTGRKGESFILTQGRSGAAGHVFVPPDTRKRLDRAQMTEPVFGSDLAYQDTVENFFLWEKQSLAGSESIGNAECAILESRPGAGDSTPYGKVRSWIDLQRMAPARVEKFDRSGRLVRRIETTQWSKDDIGRSVPASMTVQRAGSGGVTEIEGSNLRHDVKLSDRDFDPAALGAPGTAR